MITKSVEVAVANGFVAKGDTVVIAAGLDKVGSTNLLKISTVE
jgi:pyruvate kinase